MSRWPYCKGSAQSPIAIELDKVEIGDAGAFVFEGYDIPAHGQLVDNGHCLGKLLVHCFIIKNCFAKFTSITHNTQQDMP